MTGTPPTEVVGARDRIDRLEQDIADIRRWFRDKPWAGAPDGSSFGCRPYSEKERALGYGTYRDPRFLPPALKDAP